MSDNITPLRRCAICGQDLPLTKDYFYFKKSKKYIYPEKICKECSSARSAARIKAAGDGRQANPNETRVCASCKQEFPLTTEYFHKNHKAVAQFAYYCKSCQRDKHRKYYEQNAEKMRARTKTYYTHHKETINANNRQRWRSDPSVRESQRQYVGRNHDKIKAKRNQYFDKYRKQSAGVIRAISARREARKRSLPDTFTANDWSRCLDYFHHTCAVCGRPQGFWHTLAADHWIALADPRPDNPGTVPWNIVPLCHGDDGCNNSKRNRNAEEWLRYRYSAKESDAILARIAAYFDWIRAA